MGVKKSGRNSNVGDAQKDKDKVDEPKRNFKIYDSNDEGQGDNATETAKFYEALDGFQNSCDEGR